MKKLNKKSLLEIYFYAMTEASMYDASIELTVPNYKSIHKTLIDHLSYYILTKHKNEPSEITGTIFDLGIGTGAESLSILKKFPKVHVLGLDLCAPMKIMFEKNHNDEFGSSEGNFTYLVYDFLNENIDGAFISTFVKNNNEKKCMAAISAYCIHHFTLSQKEIAYRKIFEILEPGGIFLNADLFNHEDDSLSKFAHDNDLVYIREQFLQANLPMAFEKKMEMCEKWLKHMEEDNILHSVEIQIEILKKIGFKSTECIYRCGQQAIILGIK